MRGSNGMRGAMGLAVLLWVLACGAALAAADLSAPAETTPEAVQQRIDQLQAATDVEQSVKDQALAEYKAALQSARNAQDQATTTAQLARDRRDAPQQVADIRRKLAEPSAPPKVEPGNASLPDLEESLAKAQDAVAAARKTLSDLETQQAQRPSRSDVLALESKAREQLQETNAELAAAATAASPVLAAAQTTALRAKKAELEAEVARYEEQALGYAARGDLLRARHDQSARDLDDARALAARWQQVVLDKQRQEAGVVALAAQQEVAQVPPQLRPAAERNQKLAMTLAGGLTAQIDQATRALADLQSRRDQLQSDLADVKGRVGRAGLTKAMGVFLRKRQGELPNLASLEAHLRAVQDSMADAQAAQLPLLEERDALTDLDAAVQRELAAVSPPLGAEQRQALAPTLRKLLTSRQGLLARLIGRYDAYLNTLDSLAQVDSSLIDAVRSYREFVDTNILWFRSSAPMAPADVPHVVEAVRWCLSPANWLAVLRTLALDVMAVPLYYALALLVVAPCWASACGSAGSCTGWPSWWATSSRTTSATPCVPCC